MKNLGEITEGMIKETLKKKKTETPGKSKAIYKGGNVITVHICNKWHDQNDGNTDYRMSVF